MKYYYQAEGQLRNNIGDVLQGMVAQRFLPSESEVVDRESLAEIQQTEPGFLIANGWYMHAFEKFPPPENITPLYVSVHIAQSALLLDKKIRNHFKKHAPIGCRDKKTQQLFLGWGIPAYYSSCLTLTTQSRGQINQSGQGECLLVDNVDHPVPLDVKEKLESLLGTPLIRVSHNPPDISGSLERYWDNTSNHMESLLRRYCNARLVVTTKIHCALPCLGMGANVLVIHPNPDDPRLATVNEFVKVISYQEVRATTSLALPTININALTKRKSFLSELVTQAVLLKGNPVMHHAFYRPIKRKSNRSAKLYRFIINAMYRLGFFQEKIKRVYGRGGKN